MFMHSFGANTFVTAHLLFAYSSPGGFDKRLKENVEYLEELKTLAEREGVSHQVHFMTSCSTADRNALLSDCLCVLYTPKVHECSIFVNLIIHVLRSLTRVHNEYRMNILELFPWRQWPPINL